MLLPSVRFLLSGIVSCPSFICVSFLGWNYFGKEFFLILSFKKLIHFFIFASIANSLTIIYPDIFLTIHPLGFVVGFFLINTSQECVVLPCTN